MIVEPATTPGTLLRLALTDAVTPDPTLWGFGGLHGGLALALLTRAMSEQADGATLRGVTGQFHRPLRGEFTIETTDRRAGRAVRSWQASARAGEQVCVDAGATFSAQTGDPGAMYFGPPAPGVPPPSDCDVFTIPLEFVPFARHTEIRPVNDARPFAGGAEPELSAWIRLVEDDAPPDAVRLVVLMDSLAPSLSAVLNAPTMIPTIELGVRPAAGLAEASSPWVLLRARTRSVAAGWVSEDLDAWAPGGAYLGSGHQLRLVAARA